MENKLGNRIRQIATVWGTMANEKTRESRKKKIRREREKGMKGGGREENDDRTMTMTTPRGRAPG